MPQKKPKTLPSSPQGSKWQKVEGVGKATPAYTPSYAKYSQPRFSPKKAVRSFRDLDVYRHTMECSLWVTRELLPDLDKDHFPLTEGMKNTALTIPLFIADAHGLRFSDFPKAVQTLEAAMRGCNKMIVYLEQASGLSKRVDHDIIEDISNCYMQVRGKMLRLLRAWEKFQKLPQ